MIRLSLGNSNDGVGVCCNFQKAEDRYDSHMTADALVSRLVAHEHRLGHHEACCRRVAFRLPVALLELEVNAFERNERKMKKGKERREERKQGKGAKKGRQDAQQDTKWQETMLSKVFNPQRAALDLGSRNSAVKERRNHSCLAGNHAHGKSATSYPFLAEYTVSDPDSRAILSRVIISSILLHRKDRHSEHISGLLPPRIA